MFYVLMVQPGKTITCQMFLKHLQDQLPSYRGCIAFARMPNLSDAYVVHSLIIEVYLKADLDLPTAQN